MRIRRGLFALAMLMLVGSPMPAQSAPIAESQEKGSVTGNFGTVSLDCSTDGVNWYMDITLSSARGPITAYTGAVTTSRILGVHPYGGIVNPPTTNVYEQVQTVIEDWDPGLYTATLSGSGTTTQGVFILGQPTCSIKVD